MMRPAPPRKSIRAMGILTAALALVSANSSGGSSPPARSATNVSAREKKVIMDDFEIGFRLLKLSEGPEYDAAHRQWQDLLAGAKTQLRLRAGSEDWRTAVTAAILMARIEQGAEYATLLDKLDAENIAAAGKTAVGLNGIWQKYQALAKRDFRQNILPLCWEAILKHGADWPAWKVTAFLRILWVTPDPRSLEPLLWFLENNADDALAHDAAKAIACLGKEAVSARLTRVGAEHERLGKRLENVSEQLLDLGR